MADEAQQQAALDMVSEGDVTGLQALLAASGLDVDASDANGMTLLQHAVYKGKGDVAQLLVDRGADVNATKHEHNYSALHFAALSGKEDVCLMLLRNGAKSQALNSVNRTASQMAAFVGNHNCVAAINNFVPVSDLEYFTVPNGLDARPKLQPELLEPLHKLLSQVNVHPVAVLLYLQKNPVLLSHLPQAQNVLTLMSEREMKRGVTTNEVLSFKFHWLATLLEDLQMTQEAKTDKTKDKDAIEMCLKRFTKGSALDQFVRVAVRRFPYIEGTLFRQIASGLASLAKEKGVEPGASISVITTSINGHRGFASDSQCGACSNEKAKLQCSRCKHEVYCDAICQKVHWHVHKKTCSPASAAPTQLKAEDQVQLADLVAQQLSNQSLQVN